MTQVQYRVEEVGEDERGEILWVETVSYFDTLESARAFVSNKGTLKDAEGVIPYYTIWKITITATEEIIEEPIE